MIARALDTIGRFALRLFKRLELVQEERPTVQVHAKALSRLLEGREADGPTPTLLRETEKLLEHSPSWLTDPLAVDIRLAYPGGWEVAVDSSEETPMEITDSTPWTIYVSKAGAFVLNRKNAPLWDICLDESLDGIQELVERLPAGGTILGHLEECLQEEILERGFDRVSSCSFRRPESKRPGLAAGKLPTGEGRAEK